MLCIGQRHELDFSKGDFEYMDRIGAIDLGHGVWMYTRDAEEGDLGNESEKTEYCFCALGCHRIGTKTREQRSALMALGIALNLQKSIGGYVFTCEEEEGYTFYLGGMQAFQDRTYDWWMWPLEDDWWAPHISGRHEIVDWDSLANECTERNINWYLSMTGASARKALARS